MKVEIWKDIPGFEGMYQVSNLGRVRSLDYTYKKFSRWDTIIECKNKARVLTPRIHSSGYLRVQIKKKDFYIHRIVMSTF